jgi:hypothetical protein
MILGSDLQQFELAVAEVASAVPGVAAGGDVRVVVRARLLDFSGAADAWVLRDAWSEFLRQLRQLEQDRRGEASLLAISPEELRVRIFALDRAGHVGVEGELTSFFIAKHDPRAASLKFGTIEIEPSALPALVRELESAAPPA